MIEGLDYHVHYVKMPNTASEGMAVVNDDGTYDVYINTRVYDGKWDESMWHEMTHLELKHFDTDLPIERIEAQADGEPVNIVMHPPGGKIPVFSSEEAFAHWVQTVAMQQGNNLHSFRCI